MQTIDIGINLTHRQFQPTGNKCGKKRSQPVSRPLSAHLRTIVKQIPKERLMIETDAPFLIPQDLHPRAKSNRNVPAYLPHIAAEIARCRGESVEELAAYTTENAKHFFGIA